MVLRSTFYNLDTTNFHLLVESLNGYSKGIELPEGFVAGVCDYIRQAGCIQFDPIDVCGKNAELVLQSRVEGFTKDMP